MFKILNIVLLINFLFSESKIVASDGNIDDRFGKAVFITDQWLAVGANRDDDNASNSGSVYLYKYIEDIIQEEYKITSFSLFFFIISIAFLEILILLLQTC